MPHPLRRTRALWYPCADDQFRAVGLDLRRDPAAGATPSAPMPRVETFA